MADKPILFSGPMVEAILSGRKTQTRRVVNPQPVSFSGGWEFDGRVFVSDEDLKSYLFHDYYDAHPKYGAAYGDGSADQLWVRETWQAKSQGGLWWHEVNRSERMLHNWAWTNPVRPAYDEKPPRWLPGIHMPHMACRLHLEIVSVRVERVQDIEGPDARCEGVFNDPYLHEKAGDIEAGEAFVELWDKINAKRGFGWDANPWVWVVEFKAVP